MNGYKTIYKGASAQIVEKKSRFIATVFHVENENEALCFIEQLKKKYWDASHNCYAYSVGTQNPLLRCSDDGEPAKTAGRPMLDVLTGEELYNTLVVVTRYFGGTLLGTGGLVRAYQAATKAGLEASDIICKLPASLLKVQTDYTGLGKLQYIAGQLGISILDTIYTQDVCCKVLADENQQHALEKKMLEATSGQIKIEPVKQLFYAVYGKEILTFDN